MAHVDRQARFRRLEQDRFDVVIVGAGTGGLTAGALLAKRGKSVLIIDQHYVAGGCATVFKRPGYEFDIGVHYLGECGPQGSLRRILAASGVDDVEFNQMDPDGFDTLCFPDFTFRVPRGIDAYRERLVDYFPAEQRGIDRYIRVLKDASTFLNGKNDPMRLPASIVKVAGSMRWATKSLGEFFDIHIQDPQLRAVLAAENIDYAQPPSRVSMVMHLMLMAHYLVDGAYFPRGGGQIISDHLADAVETHGGKVLLKARATRIVTDRGRVQGVEFYNKHLGHRFVEADSVISNADLKKTLTELVKPDELPGKLVARAKAFEMSPGLASVYVGARRDLAGERSTNYWAFPNYDLETLYSEARQGRFGDNVFAFISVASLKDPANTRLAPRGVVNMEFMTVAPSDPKSWGTTEEEFHTGAYRNSPRYREAKDRLTSKLVEVSERALPGIADEIIFQEMSTPLTHARYTHASGGTAYGIALTPEQSLHNRPSHKTPIRGLYLCGASMRTGHGIIGAMTSGVFAASGVLGSGLLREIFGPQNEGTLAARAVAPVTSSSGG